MSHQRPLCTYLARLVSTMQMFSQPLAGSTVPHRPLLALQRPMPLVGRTARLPVMPSCRLAATRTMPLTSKPAASSASPEADSGRAPLDAQEYWADVLSKIDPSSHLYEIKEAMDPRLPVGMTREWAKSKGKTSVPCFEEYVKFKQRKHEGHFLYAKHLILMQMGEFYECIGIDALVLAKWSGYRLTNEAAGVPRAGFPLYQIRTVVNRLVSAGFSLAIVKQQEGSATAGKTMTRILDRVYSPSHISYITGELGEELGGADDNELFMKQRPIMGLGYGKSGYTLLVLLVELRKVEVLVNLTEAAVMSRLAAVGASTLFLHTRTLEDGKRTAFKTALSRFARNELGRFGTYDDADIVTGFISKVRAEVFPQVEESGSGDSKRDTRLEVVYSRDTTDGRPQPLPRSTVSQLGIEGDNAIPNLLDFLLPKHAPLACKEWMRQQVMLPPPPAEALHIRAALDFLAAFDQALPALNTELPAGKVVEVIDTASGDANFFRQLHRLLSPLIHELSDQQFEPLWDHVLPYALWMDRRHDNMSPQQLRAELKGAAQAIERVVELGGVSHTLRDTQADESTHKRPASRMSPHYTYKEEQAFAAAHKTSRDELEQAFQECEKFRKDVKPGNLVAQLKEVNAKRAALEAAVMYAYGRFADACSSGSTGAPALKAIDNAVVIYYKLNIKPFAKMKQELEQVQPPVHLVEVEHKTLRSCFTSVQVKAALQEYHDACKQAERKVRQLLSQLCEELQQVLPSLLLACRFCVIKTALEEHATMSIQQQWTTPQLAPPHGSAGGAPLTGAHPAGMNMTLTSFWPYWLPVSDKLNTITNDLTLDRFVLLTGPNMAGKSTVLRSVCAVAVLANCGLNVPAAAASVPWYDAFLLRNFSGDSPMEGKSSFALEMEDVAAADRTSTNRTLILMDELGKGTEVDKGTSIVYTVIEEWCKQRFTGICATHLLMMESIAKNEGLDKNGQLAFKNLGVGGQAKRLLDGVCYDSQAEVIASQAGIRPELLDRAYEIWLQIISGRHNPYIRHGARSWLQQPVTLTPADVGVHAMEQSVRGIARSPSLDATSPVTTTTNNNNNDVNSYDDSESSDQEQEQQEAARDSPGGTEPGFTLEQAGEVLVEVMRSQEAAAGQLFRLRPTEQPGPSHASIEVVYVFLGPLGRFYCGQTGSIKARVAEHRKSKARDKGKMIDLMYVPVKAGSADQVEALVIEELRRRGFPMSSTRKTKRGSQLQC